MNNEIKLIDPVDTYLNEDAFKELYGNNMNNDLNIIEGIDRILEEYTIVEIFIWFYKNIISQSFWFSINI